MSRSRVPGIDVIRGVVMILMTITTFVSTARWWTYGMAGVLGSAPLFLKVKKLSIL